MMPDESLDCERSKSRVVVVEEVKTSKISSFPGGELESDGEDMESELLVFELGIGEGPLIECVLGEQSARD